MNFMDTLKLKARAAPKKVVFPEGEEEKIHQALHELTDQGLATGILLGEVASIKRNLSKLNINSSRIEMIDVQLSPDLERYAEAYCKDRGLSHGAAHRILTNPLYFAAMMVKMGDADSMVAGLTYATEEVIMASELILGMNKDVTVPSSLFLMQIPNYVGEEGEYLIFADAAVNPDPTAEQLADIAISTARTATDLFCWEPRVAMLSFSTKGSAYHPRVEKVVRAVEIIRQREPGLLIDGELQADAAIIPEVAKKKNCEVGFVAGRANILIFPDLDAGNIAYKLVQRLANAPAYGPILQGFSKPVSDLSRGATVEDIVGATIMVVVRAQAR